MKNKTKMMRYNCRFFLFRLIALGVVGVVFFTVYKKNEKNYFTSDFLNLESITLYLLPHQIYSDKNVRTLNSVYDPHTFKTLPEVVKIIVCEGEVIEKFLVEVGDLKSFDTSPDIHSIKALCVLSYADQQSQEMIFMHNGRIYFDHKIYENESFFPELMKIVRYTVENDDAEIESFITPPHF